MFKCRPEQRKTEEKGERIVILFQTDFPAPANERTYISSKPEQGQTAPTETIFSFLNRVW